MPETKLSVPVELEAADKKNSSTALPFPAGNSDNSEHDEKLCFDDMLQKYCGEFGFWQRRHFLLGSLGMIVDAFLTMVMIFADREPLNWRCLDHHIHGSRCFSEAKSVCELEPGTWEWIGGSSISSVAEFGLICGQKYKVGLVQALFFGGSMIGAGVFGHLSDSRWGRKGSLIAASTFSTIFGSLTAVSPDYRTYAFLRFLAGVSKGGVALCSFVLTTEPIGPTNRGIAGISTFYFFCVGMVLLSGVAYVSSNSWRNLYLAASVPPFLFLIFVLTFISESPRWCLIKGKMNQAMEIMHKIAKTNGNYLPKHVILSLNDEIDNNLPTNNNVSTIKDSESEAVTCTLADLLRSSRRTRIRLFLAVAINFSCAVAYFGLTLNVVNLSTDLYLNVLLNAVAETPAILFSTFVLDKIGRKPLAIVTQLITGVFCVAGSLLYGNESLKVIQTVCRSMGMFGAAANSNLLFIYTVELFPTVIRNAALGYANQAAETGAVLSPFLVVLGCRIPLAFFGFCGILGGILAFYLPETLNEPLYDTMAEMEG